MSTLRAYAGAATIGAGLALVIVFETTGSYPSSGRLGLAILAVSIGGLVGAGPILWRRIAAVPATVLRVTEFALILALMYLYPRPELRILLFGIGGVIAIIEWATVCPQSD